MRREREPRDFAAALSAASDLLTSFTVPIYVDDDRGRPWQIGSGFFVRDRDGQHYLVSAAHVLEEVPGRSLYYYVEPRLRRHVSGQRVLNRWQGDRAKDPRDVGIVRLVGEGLPPYPAVRKVAMDISYLRSANSPRAGKFYATVGFPASKSRVDVRARNVEARAYVYRNYSLPDEQYNTHDLSAATNIVMPLNLKKAFDNSGKHTHFPAPQGMSGSPIWVLFDDAVEDKGGTFPVVGVATKFRKGLGIIGTDIGVVIEAMQQLRGTNAA